MAFNQIPKDSTVVYTTFERLIATSSMDSALRQQLYSVYTQLKNDAREAENAAKRARLNGICPTCGRKLF